MREGTAGEIDGGDVALDDLGAEPLGLGAHLGHEIRPHDAVTETGEVLDRRGHHQLSAGLQPFDDQGFQIGAGRVDAGSRVPPAPTR